MRNDHAKDAPVHPEYAPLAAFLSYLVPGLGQVYQGRVGKGVLFFVCILTLFFYGQYLGHWNNVYLPSAAEDNNPLDLPPLAANLYNRPQFAGQFWVGVAAWPAIVQYMAYDPVEEKGPLFGGYQRAPYESRERPEDYKNRTGKAAPNDPADPAERRDDRQTLRPNVALGDWPGETINEMQVEGDKTWDLGWVFTVIAGVLNVMVIYDALAGPAFVAVETHEVPEAA